MLSEPRISIEGGDAQVRTDFAFIDRSMKITSAGRYHDVLVQQGDRWRIASREIVFLGEQPTGSGVDT